MNNSVLSGVNVVPLKRNMEEGQFSLMRKIFRQSAKSTHRNNVGSTQNLSFQDNSSYIERKKAQAIGKEEYNPVVSYSSYDKNEVSHVTRRVRNAGASAPKKKGFTF